jgi:hypothetical protein
MFLNRKNVTSFSVQFRLVMVRNSFFNCFLFLAHYFDFVFVSSAMLAVYFGFVVCFLSRV